MVVEHALDISLVICNETKKKINAMSFQCRYFISINFFTTDIQNLILIMKRGLQAGIKENISKDIFFKETGNNSNHYMHSDLFYSTCILSLLVASTKQNYENCRYHTKECV